MKQLIQRLKRLFENKDSFIIAIDGMSASGKTTLAEKLQAELCANVIHMDDYFLPREQQNLRVLGGNIDFSRFKKEILAQQNGPYIFKRFDCKTQTYSPNIKLPFRRILVIEGTYCLHPALGKYYDYALFVSVRTETQIARIETRNKENKDMFLKCWIPLENQYFEKYQIAETSNEILYEEDSL